MLSARLSWKIFAGAVAIRWAYDVALFVTMGNDGLMGMDSRGYYPFAQNFVAAALAGNVHGLQWLGPDPSFMPMTLWVLGLHVVVFGNAAAASFVLMQGALDATTCIVIGWIAREIAPRYAAPAAIVAALNPTQIVMSGLIYTDTLFLFFVALFLYAAIAWLQAPSLRMALLVGLAVGLAALTRILVVPWTGFMFAFLAAASIVQAKAIWPQLRQLTLAALVFAACLAPPIVRNVIVYDTLALTSQTGSHYAYWLVPLVQQAKDGTPWAQGVEEMQRRVAAETGPVSTNPFERSRQLTEIGSDALHELGKVAAIKAWLFGAAVNLGAPAVTLSPPVIQLPRTGFYATPGGTPGEKVANFLFHSDNAAYAWIVLIGVAGVALVRLVQLIGLFVLARVHPTGVLLLVAWCGYILVVNGPLASPKYRLPMEVPLAVFAGAGFCALRDWRLRRNPAA